MNIAEKTRRIRSGDETQHGTHRASIPDKPPAHARLQALLRRDAAARAAETATPRAPFRSRPTAGEIATGTTSPFDAEEGQAAEVPAQAERYEDWTVEVLKDEIRARNEGRDDDSHLSISGNKAELVERLTKDDKALARF